MIRKIIKQGNGTLTITLPKQWADEVGLTGNSEIELIVNQKNLVVVPISTNNEKTITIHVDNFDRLSFAKFLIACYELGFDSMELTFTKSTVKSWSHGNEDLKDVINFFVARLVGFEILSQSKTVIRIGNIVKEHVKFESIVSRSFFLIEEYLQNLIDAMKSGDYDDLKNGENRHDNITKFIALATRELYEGEKFTKAEAFNLAVILTLLDKVTDFIRYSYKYTVKHNSKISPDTIALAQNAALFIEKYREFFHKFSFTLINEMDSIRGDVKSGFVKIVESKAKEAAITAQFDALVETLHGGIKSRIAIDVDKGNHKY
jgi:phosphate uptake regulator